MLVIVVVALNVQLVMVRVMLEGEGGSVAMMGDVVGSLLGEYGNVDGIDGGCSEILRLS